MTNSKIFKIILCIGFIISILTACDKGSSDAQKRIKIGATPVPHAEILEFTKSLLEEKGYTLEIIQFNDYIQPNLALRDSTLDANFFQHIPYMKSFSEDHDIDLISAGTVHLEPLGVYSDSISDLAQLKKGSVVTLPNDVTNHGRALILLHKANIISLKDPENLKSHFKTDILENPLELEFRELDSPMLSKTLQEVDISVINTNFALDAGLNPLKDALFLEGSDSPYGNIVCILDKEKDSEKIKVLMEVLKSDEVSSFIKEKYDGSIIPTN